MQDNSYNFNTWLSLKSWGFNNTKINLAFLGFLPVRTSTGLWRGTVTEAGSRESRQLFWQLRGVQSLNRGPASTFGESLDWDLEIKRHDLTVYWAIYSVMSRVVRSYHVGSIPSRHVEIPCHAPHQKLFNLKYVNKL